MAVLYPLIPLTQRLLTHWETEEERKRGLRRLDVVIAAWVLVLGLWYSPPLSPWRIPDAVPLTRETMWSVDGGLFFVRKLVSYLTLYGYMLLGYRLRLWTENMDGRRMRMWKWVAAVVYVATTAVCALGTAWLTHRNGRLDVAMQGYMQVNTVLQSWAVFMLLAGTDLRRWSERRGMGWIADVRDSLSRCSYGIYLIHIMVISTLWSFRIYWGIGNPIWSVPLLTAAVTAVSWAVVWLIGRWRWGRYVVG